MPSTTLDDRTFDSGVEPTPEETASTLAYFKEKGYDVEAIAEGATEPEKPETPPATVVPPADKVAEPEPVVPTEQTPAVVAAPAEPEIEIDPESRHDFESAKNDGEKLGRLAKKTKIINELKGTVAQKDGTIDELRRLLAEKEKSPAPAPVEPSPLVATPAKVEVKKDPEPEAIKPGEFSEPEPALPKLADYADLDDPVEALENARTEYVKKLNDWAWKKRDFDHAEKERIASESKKRDQQQSAQTQRQQRITQRYEEAKRQYPDFETRTAPSNLKMTPTMVYLFKEGLPDGFTLAYELTKPEHAETLKSIYDSTNLSEADKTDPDKVAEVINQAVGELAVFRARLKSTEPAQAEAAAATAAPATPAPVKPPPQTPPAAQPSAAAQPRKEEPSPEPARGRGAPATRLEDIPLDDYDARREWRKRNGEL
jgi:hypothetical protein